MRGESTCSYRMANWKAFLPDFIWWSGLSATEARKGLELIQSDFISEEMNGRTFWMRPDIQEPGDSALLLPSFDEYVVSYKDRSEIIEDKHYAKVMTKNGLFSPTIMCNGEIVGSWKRVMKKGQPEVELTFFKKEKKAFIDLFQPAIKSVQSFYCSP